MHKINTEAEDTQKQLTKNQMRYQQHKQKINDLKQEYISAGGNITEILQSRNLGEIKGAIVLLQNEKNKKNKKKK